MLQRPNRDVAEAMQPQRRVGSGNFGAKTPKTDAINGEICAIAEKFGIPAETVAKNLPRLEKMVQLPRDYKKIIDAPSLNEAAVHFLRHGTMEGFSPKNPDAALR